MIAIIKSNKKPANSFIGILRLCLVFLVFSCAHLQAATTAQIDTARSGAVAWLIQDQHGSGYWRSSSSYGAVETAAVLQALRNAGVIGMPYSRGVSWLRNAGIQSVDTLARQILALDEAGSDIQSSMSRLLAMRNDFNYGWGAYSGYGSSIPDTPVALDAILATGTTYADTSSSLFYLTNNQNAIDGGWSYQQADAPVTPQSRIVPTALTVLTLIRYRDNGWGMQSNITSGINYLLGQQNVDGSFGDDAGTVVETAVAYAALEAELGSVHAAAVAAQDFLIAQQDVNGSWGNVPYSTALVLKTLPATTMADSDNDGVPDLVETQLGTDPLVPDSRYLATGNSQGLPGVNYPTNVTNANLNEFLQIQLADTGGTGPFTWVIISGELPAGMSLLTGTNQIEGTPTTAGTYSFTYDVTGSDQQTVRLVTQIIITAPAIVADGDVNKDGNVDVVDILVAQRILMGQIIPTAQQLIHGDVAPLSGGAPVPDGVFNLGDLLVIQRKALGLVNF